MYDRGLSYSDIYEHAHKIYGISVSTSAPPLYSWMLFTTKASLGTLQSRAVYTVLGLNIESKKRSIRSVSILKDENQARYFLKGQFLLLLNDEYKAYLQIQYRAINSLNHPHNYVHYTRVVGARIFYNLRC